MELPYSYQATRAAWAKRRKQVLAMREKGMTLQQIGDHLGITRERVRQICKRERAEAARRLLW